MCQVRPGGNEPPEIANAYGVWPQLAASDCEYEVPTYPSASDEVVNESNANTVRASGVLAACALASTTVTLNDAAPRAVGVPEMAPLVESERPAGSAPDEKLQL